MCYENLRNLFRPENIRVLFVGESRPANGTFFYLGNSNLASFTRQAFESALEKQFPDIISFLYCFSKSGCFLDDLCPEPVNNLPPNERHAQRLGNIPLLAERLAEYQPQFLIVTPMSIHNSVAEAVNLSGIEPLEHCTLPFPAMNHQHQYVTLLTEFLNQIEIKSIFTC